MACCRMGCIKYLYLRRILYYENNLPEVPRNDNDKHFYSTFYTETFVGHFLLRFGPISDKKLLEIWWGGISLKLINSKRLT